MFLRHRVVLGLFLAGLVAGAGNPVYVQGTGHEAKIDPFLRFGLASADGETLERLFGAIEGDRVELLVRATEDVTPLLESYGGEVRSVIGDGAIMTATLPRAAVQTVAGDPRIVRLEAPKPLVYTGAQRLELDHAQERPLDTSVGEIKVPQLWNEKDSSGAPLRGKGVIIGVVDTGIDWTHKDFRTATGGSRILSIWDQTLEGSGPEGTAFKYGIECRASQLDAGTCTSKDVEGHGTHVASIAAGNGLSVIPPVHLGVAPDADLIAVKIALGKSLSTRGIDAWKYIVDKAKALERPVVINNSWGHFVGAKDGTDSMEVALDLLSGAGKIFVNAAGNSGEDKVHAQGTVPRGGTTTVTVGFPEPDPTAPAGIVIWYDDADSIAVSVKTPAGETLGPVRRGGTKQFTHTSGAKVAVDATEAPSTANGDNGVAILLTPAPGTSLSGEWSLILQGDTILNEGRFDAWLVYGILKHGTQVFKSHVSAETTIGEPATARKGITVANYVTRRCIDSITKEQACLKGPEQVGALHASSSRGPTRDGRKKPDLAAPGTIIVAAMSADSPPVQPGDPDRIAVAADGKHIAAAGTSMAAPHVTGVIALLLQRHPKLLPETVQEALTGSARKDSFTKETWNSGFGWGKLDAVGAAERAVPPPPITVPPGGLRPAEGVRLPAIGATLLWSNPPGAAQYHLDVKPAKGAGPAIEVMGPTSDIGFTLQEPALGKGPYVMLPGTSYSWRVRASSIRSSLSKDDPAWGPWSAVETFQTAERSGSRISPLFPPDKWAMGSGAQVLRWENKDKDVFFYEVQISLDPTFGTGSWVWTNHVHGGLSNPFNSWKTPVLAGPRTYYWRVRPVQGDGIPSGWGPTWSFRVVL